jgi:hypothetical protein
MEWEAMMSNLTRDQQEAVALLSACYPAGLLYDPDQHGEAIDVMEELVESGHAVRIEGDDVPGVGYQLSEQMARAHLQLIRDRAEQAGQN